MDKGLLPSDYESSGIIIDDILHKILAKFNLNTQILFICDACHSGSILDLKFVWDTERPCKFHNSISQKIDNIMSNINYNMRIY